MRQQMFLSFFTLCKKKNKKILASSQDAALMLIIRSREASTIDYQPACQFSWTLRRTTAAQQSELTTNAARSRDEARGRFFLIYLDACVSTMHTGLACFPSSWNTVTLCSGSNEWQQHYEAMISQKSNAVIKWGGPSLHASKKENTWSWTWPCRATVVWEGGAWKACT